MGVERLARSAYLKKGVIAAMTDRWEELRRRGVGTFTRGLSCSIILPSVLCTPAGDAARDYRYYSFVYEDGLSNDGFALGFTFARVLHVGRLRLRLVLALRSARPFE